MTSGHRRYIGPKGIAFRNEVKRRVESLNLGTPLDCPVSVVIDAYPPDRRRRDLDNLLKAVGDSLEFAGVIVVDSIFEFLSIQKMGARLGGDLDVEIEEM
jgi:crossover junction endodeoxyribonuclease RusA